MVHFLPKLGQNLVDSVTHEISSRWLSWRETTCSNSRLVSLCFGSFGRLTLSFLVRSGWLSVLLVAGLFSHKITQVAFLVCFSRRNSRSSVVRMTLSLQNPLNHSNAFNLKKSLAMVTTCGTLEILQLRNIRTVTFTFDF